MIPITENFNNSNFTNSLVQNKKENDAELAEIKNSVISAINLLKSEKSLHVIDKDKTIRNGREECNNYRSYIEIYLRNKELAAGGYLSGTSYDEVPSSGSSGKSPDSKFVGYIVSTEKKKPLIEFDKLINAVSQIDENCGKYLYMTYYENMKSKEINAALNLKNRYEGYRVINKAYFIVACLVDEVEMR